MKPGLIVFLFLFLTVLILPHSAQAGVIEKKYHTGKPAVRQHNHFSLVSFENTLLSGKTGEPTLPYFQVRILLPPGEVAESIEFIGEDRVDVPGIHVLFPYQLNKPVTESGRTDVIADGNDLAGKGNQFIINNKVYSQGGVYPDNPTGHLTTQYLYGFPFAIAAFTPVCFFPLQNKIQYYQQITIRIHTRSATTNNHTVTPSLSRKAQQLLRQFAQNPEMCDNFPPVNSDTEDYQLLIITPELFAGHFQELVDHYFIRGMKSKIITTSTIYSTYTGSDDQEKIRNCIIQEYQDNQIEHVMLAGDNELVPSRGFYCQVQSSSVYTDYNIPADLYYSALDGNWNTDGDDMWAEPGEEDLLPEVSVGRLTVNTVDELGNFINKIIHYQNVPVVAECRKPLMVGEKLYDNPLTWGGDYMDLLIGQHNDNGYTTTGIPDWHGIQKLYDRDLPVAWNSAALLGKINEGASFLHHCGHSNANYLMRLPSSSVTNANFSQVNGINHNYIPVYSHGCICAAFDYNDCIAEKMLNLNTFAVAFIGNSRYGWFNEGTTEGPSEHLHREFVHALYSEGKGQTGMAHLLSKLHTAPWVNAPGQWEEGALRWCFYDCNVLGDPAMFVWTDKPMDLTVTHDDTLSASAAVLAVHCDTAGIAVPGLNCVVFRDSLLIGKAVTDDLGNVQIMLGSPPLDTGQLTVVISGTNCLPDTSLVRIVPVSSISGTITYGNTQQTPIRNAVVSLLSQGNPVLQTNADTNGCYRFETLDPGSYTIQVSTTIEWGGVNSTDALLILRHFIQISLLSGLKLQAADVDNSHYINTLDAFLAQKRFVNIVNSFPSGDWIFQSTPVNLGEMETMVVHISGLCMGDVNNSYVP